MLDIAQIRLANQQLSSQKFEKPEDVVGWFGAMQAQDFAAAKWALALRSKNQTDESIEKACNEGRILRTHIMRPTWHFVLPSDIRWLQKLTFHRIHQFNGYYYRQTDLNKTIFQKSNEILRNALIREKKLTRLQLGKELQSHGIPIKGLGLSYTILQAELENIITSGPRVGKQFTYMLLDERVPKSRELSYEESLVELSKKYFQSHGPAQEKDFSWWSGLRLTDVRKGIEMLGSKLSKFQHNEKMYYWMESAINESKQDSFLVPGFDEYFIAYADRSDVLDEKYKKELNQGGGMVSGAVVVDGRMVGGWKRMFEKKKVVVSIRLFEKVSTEHMEKIKQQADKYSIFISHPLILEIM